MYYEIKHGVVSGRNLTNKQRSSPLFAEEPVVLGKVFRRMSRPLTLTQEQFERNKVNLLRLEKAGSIRIHPHLTSAKINLQEPIVGDVEDLTSDLEKQILAESAAQINPETDSSELLAGGIESVDSTPQLELESVQEPVITAKQEETQVQVDKPRTKRFKAK